MPLTAYHQARGMAPVCCTPEAAECTGHGHSSINACDAVAHPTPSHLVSHLTLPFPLVLLLAFWQHSGSCSSSPSVVSASVVVQVVKFLTRRRGMAATDDRGQEKSGSRIHHNDNDMLPGTHVHPSRLSWCVWWWRRQGQARRLWLFSSLWTGGMHAR